MRLSICCLLLFITLAWSASISNRRIVRVKGRSREPRADYSIQHQAQSAVSPIFVARDSFQGNNFVGTQHASARLTDPRTKPIAIIKSVYNPPGTTDNDSWNYVFETENGIKQNAEGETRIFGQKEEDVGAVMKGSYEYLGNDGLTYIVDWYADETGFHPSGAHLPQPVPIPFPEQARAVEAQIKFAREHPESEFFKRK